MERSADQTRCGESLILTDFRDSSGNGHLAVAAVKVQSKASAVVYKEKRSDISGFVMDRAYPQFISYAVFCSHKFCIRSGNKFKSLFYRFSSGSCIDFCGNMIGCSL